MSFEKKPLSASDVASVITCPCRHFATEAKNVRDQLCSLDRSHNSLRSHNAPLTQPKPQHCTPKPQRTTDAAEAATMRRNNTPAMQPKPQLGWARTGKDDTTQPKPLSPPGSGRTNRFSPGIRQRCSRSRRLLPNLEAEC